MVNANLRVRVRSATRLQCAERVMPVEDGTRRVPGAATRLTAGGMRISDVVSVMARQIRRPVVDRTG
jgi:hypothetical protein